jgi:hypothetical protein
MTSRHTSPLWQGVAEGPQDAAVQVVGQYCPDRALTHLPHSDGPQQASPTAQTLPPHKSLVPVEPPLPPVPPVAVEPPPPPAPPVPPTAAPLSTGGG